MLSQLLWVPMVRIEKYGSDSVWHNDSAEAIFMGCCRNISLPCVSPVKNNPTAAARTTKQPRMAAGRYMVCASSARGLRTIHHALTPDTNTPAVSRLPATACANAHIAVLLVSSATMLSSSARLVVGL